ncbi:MAG: LLM class F420-dependent oxidoreductase [Thermomicrobiales bacterium]
MKLGVHLRPTDDTIDIRDLAPAVEEAGFESLWVSEHSHIPVATASQWPGGEGMPRFMSRFLDPFISLARAAAVTERIMLGTGIVLLPQRDTIQVAKEVSTLDYQSGGRILLGVGAGWNREEMENHGVDFGRRFGKMREQVLAIKAIWTEDEPEYHGRQVRFDPIQIWPKPVQQPRLPILIGGEGPTVLDRVIQYGDGWIPNDYPELPDRAAELAARLRESGRDPLPVTAFAVEPDPPAHRTAGRGGYRALRVQSVPGRKRQRCLPG